MKRGRKWPKLGGFWRGAGPGAPGGPSGLLDEGHLGLSEEPRAADGGHVGEVLDDQPVELLTREPDLPGRLRDGQVAGGRPEG